MKIVPPSYEILTPIGEVLKHIELSGRVCYKSEDRITDESAKLFVKKLIDSKHESVLEHYSISVRFIVDRGISHELVRHRIASFSQSSTRYISYAKEKHGGELPIICPPGLTPAQEFHWKEAVLASEKAYLALIADGVSPQIARSVMPTCLQTEIIVTANLREWRLIFKQRTAKEAHPQMREIMCPLLQELKNKIPVVFDDI